MTHAAVLTTHRRNFIPNTRINNSVLALLALFPLLMGGAVYIFWRDPSLLMFKWANTLGIEPLIELMRGVLGEFKGRLPAWFLYSWPDAAWVISGMLFFAWIWRGSRSRARHFWILHTPSLAIASELAQRVRLLPGTFDPTDLAACCLATSVGVFVACRFYSYEF
jgi:hypothetical protein